MKKNRTIHIADNSVDTGSYMLLSLFNRFKELLWDNPFKPWFISALVVINVLGSVYGYYWYWDQLMNSPVIWYLFIPDSPLSTTLFAAALTISLLKRKNALLGVVAAVAVIKYGFWAVVLITDYWLAGGSVRLVEVGLWLSHLGMALQGVIFLRHWPVYPWHVAAVTLWLLANDVVDYGLGMHPYLFYPGQKNLAMTTAAILSTGLILCLGLISPGRRSEGKHATVKE